MAGVRAPRGAGLDASSAVSSNSAAQLSRHVVGDCKVPPAAGLFCFPPPQSSWTVLSCRDKDLHGFFM